MASPTVYKFNDSNMSGTVPSLNRLNCFNGTSVRKNTSILKNPRIQLIAMAGHAYNLNRSQIRKLPKRVCLGRLCAVCSDMATGMHYGIYTCNGCEAFFRRTVINNRQFCCSRGGTCAVNYQERCVCRACRFEKCLTVGMDRDSVHCNKSQTAPYSNLSPEQSTPIPPPRSPYTADMNTLLNLENRLQQLRLYNLPIQRSLVDSLTQPSLFDAPNSELMRYAEYSKLSQLDGSLNRLAVLVRKDCVLFTEYAKCFPIFFQLSLDDKNHIIQNNTLMQQTLTQAFHSCYIAPVTTAQPVDCSIDRQILHDEQQQPCSSNNSKQAFNEHRAREDDGLEVSSITTKVIDRLVQPMREHRVEMSEIALLRVLLFLDPAQDCLSAEAREALEEERRKYFSLLLSNAIEKHGNNGPQRFAFILLLSNALQEIAIDKKRALVTFDFFATSTEVEEFPDSLLDNNTLNQRADSCTKNRRTKFFTLLLTTLSAIHNPSANLINCIVLLRSDMKILFSKIWNVIFMDPIWADMFGQLAAYVFNINEDEMCDDSALFFELFGHPSFSRSTLIIFKLHSPSLAKKLTVLNYAVLVFSLVCLFRLIVNFASNFESWYKKTKICATEQLLERYVVEGNVLHLFFQFKRVTLFVAFCGTVCPPLQIPRVQYCLLLIVFARFPQFFMPQKFRRVVMLFISDIAILLFMSGYSPFFNYFSSHCCNRISYFLDYYFKSDFFFTYYSIFSLALLTGNNPALPLSIDEMFLWLKINPSMWRTKFEKWLASHEAYPIFLHQLLFCILNSYELFFLDTVIIGWCLSVLLALSFDKCEDEITDAFWFAFFLYGFLDRTFLFSANGKGSSDKYMGLVLSKTEINLIICSSSFQTMILLCSAFAFQCLSPEKLSLCALFTCSIIISRIRQMWHRSFYAFLSIPFDALIIVFLSSNIAAEYDSILSLCDFRYYVIISFGTVCLSRLSSVEAILIGRLIYLTTGTTRKFRIQIASVDCCFEANYYSWRDFDHSLFVNDELTVISWVMDTTDKAAVSSDVGQSSIILLHFSHWQSFTNDAQLCAVLLDYLLNEEIYILAPTYISTDFDSEIQVLQNVSMNSEISIDNDHVLITCCGPKALLVPKNNLIQHSVVFAAMLRSDSIERRTNRVDISDVDFETMTELIRFVYCGSIRHVDVLATNLLIAAEKYQIASLKHLCEEYLIEMLSLSTCCDLLLLADVHCAVQLKDAATNCIVKNSTRLDVMDNWPVVATYPSLITDIFRSFSHCLQIAEDKILELEDEWLV